jgi:oxaloacetate decarboxylase alpha subunit|tara:strand:+ start:262 stop:441 length:180 start_codon:yes stop_codon:yes gene_type:complete
VFSIKVAVGDQVNEGDVVIILESMKMETEVRASTSGSIKSIQAQEGQNVKTGDTLLVIG